MGESEPLQPLSDSQRETLEESISAYESAITVEAANYLIDRGLTPATVKGFRLGVVADPLPGHERFRGWLAIPYLDRNDKPLSIRFRCIAQHDHSEYGHGKYNSMPGEPTRMFNVRAVHQAGDVIHIAEGELDAMVLNQIGMPAVAIPGVSNFKAHHRRMLAGFNRIWCWGDGDDAGADFSNRLTQLLRQAKAVRVPSGMDVNAMWLACNQDIKTMYSFIGEGV